MRRIQELTKTPYTNLIHNMFNHSFKKEWYETYWAIDLHGTVLEPSYNLNNREVSYYPYAKEVLQLLSNRDDIELIMWTSSYPNEIVEYNNQFRKDGILFNSINENAHISSKNGNFGFYEKKFYFNVLFDDKAAFNPLIEWEAIYKLLMYYDENNFLPNDNWTTKY